MRPLCAGIFLLILILCFCLWYGYEIASATDRLSDAARSTVTKESTSALISLWENKKGIIFLSVNRRLVADAEKALALMQAHISDSDPALFHSARTTFLQAMETIRSSYSISFGSII
ncbi:MAG: hypothetical protein E7616_04375 [Ruminococcaceae bacterium]|nr:hypothetical protein [Oscillospiraceae bacterium]